MKSKDDYRNGVEGNAESEGDSSGSGSGSESGEGEETSLSLYDDGAPARVLAALNALRKSRQHYDVVLLAGAGGDSGGEVPAHRAVLAAASPHLLLALSAPPAASTTAVDPHLYRVEGVDAEALRALVEYAYTGRLRVRSEAAARRLYVAAWRLRVETVRAHLAARLVRRAAPATCLELRALPALGAELAARLHHYISDHFDAICEVGALTTLPVLRVDMLREEEAPDGEGGAGEESPLAVAEAALVWLRTQPDDVDLEELCSRTHMLYVNAAGALRDCGELPAERSDAPALCQYRREAAERAAAPRPERAAAPPAHTRRAEQLGVRREAEREPRVLAARGAGAGGARALLEWRGRLALVHCAWRASQGLAPRPRLAGGARGGQCAGGADMARARCAHGTAALGARLAVCGGYDRARVLRACELYDAASNSWSALPDMRSPRARMCAARLGDDVYVFAGSDGQNELDTVEVLRGGRWAACARLREARVHAAGAAHEEQRAVLVVGGWSGARPLRDVARYCARGDAWSEVEPLRAARSQCAAVVWRRALWALGGCDAWHCLASTERLELDEAGAVWSEGPPLPTARRSMGGCQWLGRLVSAGGSDGAASLHRVDWLAAEEAAWRPLPGLRVPRAALGLAVLGDALYAVGGFSGKEFLASAEYLASPDSEWTHLVDVPSPAAPLADHHERNETAENGRQLGEAPTPDDVAATVSV